ncbi:hypothetical protein WJX84_005144, partial [Apatococcus fuscideae]
MMQQRRDQVKSGDVSWVRQQLSPEDSADCPDAQINRFIRAANFSREQALKRLQDTLAWRHEQQPAKIVCQRCRDRDDPHYMHVCGFDKEGRPILYSVFNLAENRGIEENRKHMLSTFEQAIKMMGPGVEQWVWFADFKGFGWQDCDPRLAQIFLDVSAKHYPERLGLFLIIDPPRIFRGLWRMLQPYIDPATKKKVAVLPYDFNKGNASMAFQLFNANFDKETTAWLMTEMKENRERKIAQRKSYTYQDLVKAQYPLQPGVHDNRGTRELVECISSNPRILHPMVDVPAAKAAAGLRPSLDPQQKPSVVSEAMDGKAKQGNGYQHVHAEAVPTTQMGANSPSYSLQQSHQPTLSPAPAQQPSNHHPMSHGMQQQQIGAQQDPPAGMRISQMSHAPMPPPQQQQQQQQQQQAQDHP